MKTHIRENEAWIVEELEVLRGHHLLREVHDYAGSGGVMFMGGRRYLNLSSNDYLNLAHDVRVTDRSRALLNSYGTSAAASRLTSGSLACHDELEKRLAASKGYPAALLFGSGYQANIGIITSIAGRGDDIFADRLVHASIIDACVMSRAHLHRFNHNEPTDLRRLLAGRASKGRRWVITESVFSMDGDMAPLEALAAVAGEGGAMMMVDEAHAMGVVGHRGAGLVSDRGLQHKVSIVMGTLSKGLGGFGGFAVCSVPMRDLLVNFARSFIYSTALPPAVIGSALGALDVLEKEPDLGMQLLKRAAEFRAQIRAAGLEVGPSQTQIIPVMVGDSAKALSLSRRLRDNGIIAVAIRPPTVPKGTARIRLSVTLAHSDTDLREVARLLTKCAAEESMI
jgi:8-amino-7-oxononanoate synthase